MLLRTLLAVISFILSLLAVEVLTRAVAALNQNTYDLANAGSGRMPPVIRSFNDYLALHSNELRPHQGWHGYYTNALGFNDREFKAQRSDDRYRILSLGDSFLFSRVDYPHNVMTLLEEQLSSRCNKPVEILNFGVPGATMWDYHTLYALEGRRYNVDLVILHLYLGNDVPDTVNGKDWLPEPGYHSYFFTLARNLIRLKRESLSQSPPNVHQLTPSFNADAEGGRQLPNAESLGEDSPALTLPIYSEAAWGRITREELMRFYSPRDNALLERAWSRMFALIKQLQSDVERNHARLVVVTYPSRLQIEEDTLTEAVARFTHRRAPDFSRAAVDLSLPVKVLSSFCAQEGIPCLDVTNDMRREYEQHKQPLYVPRDTHWNIRGNSRAAQAESSLLGPLVCSAKAPQTPAS
jgi:hypothetical protein